MARRPWPVRWERASAPGLLIASTVFFRSIGSQMDNEFRLRLGVSRVGDREPRASTPLWPLDFHGVPTVAVEFEGGYSWFL